MASNPNDANHFKLLQQQIDIAHDKEIILTQGLSKIEDL